MKKIYIFCLLISAYIITPKNALAQYKSVLGDSSTSWSIIPLGYCDATSSDTFVIGGDTMINNISYKKLNTGAIQNFFKGYLREDTTSGRIWYLNERTNGGKERLVMELTLQKGDSFAVDSNIYNGKLKYRVVDSVYFLNNLKHIRFKGTITLCGDLNEPLTFIEGMGTTAGFMYEASSIDDVRGYMLCQFKDGEKTFSNKRYKGECYVNEVGIEEDNQRIADLKLYPNPTSGKGIITFQNNENACLNLEIYDLNGKRIFTNSSKNAYITFDINAFEQGVYVYKLMNEKGEFSSGRILKQ